MKTTLYKQITGQKACPYEHFNTLSQAKAMLFNIFQSTIETDDVEISAGKIKNEGKILIMPNDTTYFIERNYDNYRTKI